MLDANPALTPAEVYTALEGTAIDMETPGLDFDSGFGFIRAELAVDAVSGPDSTPLTVTINQAGAQADPTNASPINFTVVFSEDVTGFTNSDVTLGGTAGATTATVNGSGDTYNVAVSGMTGDGTVTASIAANVATDASGNGNLASTSTDNTVTFNAPAATETIEIVKATYSSRKNQLKVEATSSLGGETGLAATYFVDGAESSPPKDMSYNAKKNKWSVTFDSNDGLTTKPQKVKVCFTTIDTCAERTDIGGK